MNAYNNITVTWNDPRDHFSFADNEGFSLDFVKDDGVYFGVDGDRVKLDLSLFNVAFFQEPGPHSRGEIAFMDKDDAVVSVSVNGDMWPVVVDLSKTKKKEFLALTSTLSFPGGNIEIDVC